METKPQDAKQVSSDAVETSLRKHSKKSSIASIDLIDCPSDDGEDFHLLVKQTITGRRRFSLNMNDVLVDNDSQAFQHQGNLRFRKLIQDRHALYMAATTRHAKNLVCAKIIKEIRYSDPPGRFLQRDATTRSDGAPVYRDIGDHEAIEKVINCYLKASGAVSEASTTTKSKASSIVSKNEDHHQHPFWERHALFVGNDLINWDIHRLQSLLPPQDWRHVYGAMAHVAEQLTKAIASKGGLFLDRRNGAWYQIRSKEAVKKVYKTLFRYLWNEHRTRGAKRSTPRELLTRSRHSSFPRCKNLLATRNHNLADHTPSSHPMLVDLTEKSDQDEVSTMGEDSASSKLEKPEEGNSSTKLDGADDSPPSETVEGPDKTKEEEER